MRGMPLGAVVIAIAFAGDPAAASAHEGHASCRAAGAYIASMARDPDLDFGGWSSEFAQLGLRNEFVADLHEEYCEPRP
jgi:hypothetical protein